MSKQVDELASYEMWDLTSPTLPSHSRLYCLEPYGLGTPYIESLTSYIMRLAYAHSVSVRTLVLQELVNPMGRQYIAKNNINSLLKTSGHSFNGTDLLAMDFARVLESLTCRRNLDCLTLAPWASVLSHVHLLKREKAWCPDCFADWQSAGKPLYEPLIWHIRAVTVCPRHQKPLVKVCPYNDCHAAMPPLSTNSRVGYCPKCSRWLGTLRCAEEGSSNKEELNWQIWVSEVVGQLLEHNTNLSTAPQLVKIPYLITSYLEHVAFKSMYVFEKEIQLSRTTISAWQKCENKPQLESLLRLCYCCEVSLYELFTLPAEIFTAFELKNRPLPKSLTKYQAHRKPVRFDIASVKQALERTLASEEPPPSMREVARRLDRGTTKELRIHFPDLCKAISRRYTDFRKNRAEQKRQAFKNAIKQIVLKIHSKGEYPDHDKVMSLLDKSVSRDYILGVKYWREALQELRLVN
jgi:hypothetical protein